MIGEQIVLVNRTTKELSFQADGRSYRLKPGKNFGFLEGHARFAMAQNPLMGTEDYHTMEYDSLVGVMTLEGEEKYPCDTIPDAVIEAAKDAERFMISSLNPRRQQRQAIIQRALKGRIGSALSEVGDNSFAAQ